MITMLLLVLFIASGVINVRLMHRNQALTLTAPERVVYKEIEVIKKAMCECDHPSSMHIAENPENPTEGGCQREFQVLDGKAVQESYKCFCVKYVGPEPYLDFFDAGVRELETVLAKEIE